MATIKSFTDVNQSKKLAKILPSESADMVYIWHTTSDNHTFRFDNDMPPMVLKDVPTDEITANTLPCWSLAALLSIIRKTIGYIIYGINNVYISCERNDSKKIETNVYDNEVDACVDMVIKLSKFKLL